MVPALTPIPSPFGVSDTARAFWRKVEPSPIERNGSIRHAVRGLDRRRRARPSMESTNVERIRAPSLGTSGNEAVRASFALQAACGWALVRSVHVAPRGVLVRLLDPCDPTMEPAQRRVARRLFQRLAPHLTSEGAGPRHTRTSSPLATVGDFVLASKVVARLSTCTQSDPPRHVELVISTHAMGQSSVKGAIVRIPGEIVALADPHPDLLGIALTEDQLARFTAAARHSPWAATGCATNPS